MNLRAIFVVGVSRATRGIAKPPAACLHPAMIMPPSPYSISIHSRTPRIVASIGLLVFWFHLCSFAAQRGEEMRGPTVTISNAVTQIAGEPIRVIPEITGHTGMEIAFACSVLIFGFLLVLVEAFLAYTGKLSGSAAFKLIGLTIVISSGLFVIPAGFSSNQMTPLMGLLGAIAGYLLGKDGTNKSERGAGE